MEHLQASFVSLRQKCHASVQPFKSSQESASCQSLMISKRLQLELGHQLGLQLGPPIRFSNVFVFFFVRVFIFVFVCIIDIAKT